LGAGFTSADEPSFRKWGEAARGRFLESLFVTDAGAYSGFRSLPRPAS
jgi:hypothetical protein